VTKKVLYWGWAAPYPTGAGMMMMMMVVVGLE